MSESITDIQVIGYHGCKQEVKDSILSEQDIFKKSKNPWDWLGDGVYFWENDHERARTWANTYHRGQGAVIGARISLSSCFDLANSISREFLPVAYQDLAIHYQLEGRAMPVNINPRNYQGEADDLVLRFLDRAVMHHLFTTLLPLEQPAVNFGTIRAPFQEGGELYPGSRFYQQDHIQICVRDLSCIVDLFDPLQVGLS